MPTAPAARGHAIEVRLNAEEPHNDFAPAGGTVHMLAWPTGPGIRVDAGVAEQGSVGSRYDSLLAKIIAWAPTREQARVRLIQALGELVVLGVQTNRDYLLALLRSGPFVEDELHTRWLSTVEFTAPTVPTAVHASLLHDAKANQSSPTLTAFSAFARGDRWGRP